MPSEKKPSGGKMDKLKGLAKRFKKLGVGKKKADSGPSHTEKLQAAAWTYDGVSMVGGLSKPAAKKPAEKKPTEGKILMPIKESDAVKKKVPAKKPTWKLRTGKGTTEFKPVSIAPRKKKRMNY